MSDPCEEMTHGRAVCGAGGCHVGDGFARRLAELFPDVEWCRVASCRSSSSGVSVLGFAYGAEIYVSVGACVLELRSLDGRVLANESGACMSDHRGELESATARLVVRAKQVLSDGRYRDYLRSDAWRQRRNDALRRDGFVCVRCSGRKRLEVHHLTYARMGHEEPNDLVTLCSACHQAQHKTVKA